MNIYKFQSHRLQGGAAPETIKIVKLGEFHYGKKKFIINQEYINNLIKNFQTKGTNIPIDINHAALIEGAEAPALGYITGLFMQGEWLMGKVEWNERGKKAIEGDEYRYMSITLVDIQDANSGKWLSPYLFSVSVTNNPHISEHKIAASVVFAENGEELDGTSDDTENGEGAETEENQMDELLKELGLKADATEEEALEALSKLKAPKQAPKELTEAAGVAENATPQEIAASVLTMRDKLSKLEEDAVPKSELEETREKLAKVEEQLALSAAEKEVDALIGTKLTPAQRDVFVSLRKKDEALFKSTVAVMPDIALTARAIPEGEPKKQKSDINPEIRKRSGLSDEDFEKYGVE